MANMNIRKPKFYTDHVNFLMATGTEQNGNFDVVSGTDLISTFSAGSEPELFDMRPLNQCQFGTRATSTLRSDHVLINIDLGGSVFNCDFVAILNHNMDSSKSKFRVSSHSSTESNVQQADMVNAEEISGVTGIVNTANISQNVIRPTQDGSTIITFTPSSNRYWGIQFEGSEGAENTNAKIGTFADNFDLKIGCILIGESYTMPKSPDLSVRRIIQYDGVNVQTSRGGQRFANSSNLGRRFINARSKSPFATSTTASSVYGGRIIYNMSFSFIQSTDIMPTAYDSEVSASDTVVSDVWNRTKGNLLPFIFSSDSSDTGNNAEQSHIFARFAQDSLTMNQVAPDVFNINFNIEEEF